MKSGYGFLRIYLYTVIVIALVGLTDAVLTYLEINPPLYVRIVSFLLFLFFFFNVFALAIFRRHHSEKILYVLPMYHIFSYIFFLSLGLYLTISGFNPSWLSVTLIGVQAASSLFELIFSAYLLIKFDVSLTS